MTEVPADMPEIIPVADPIVATVVVPLIHEPPALPSANVTAEPAHTFNVPVITAGSGLIVVMVVAEHPVGNV